MGEGVDMGELITETRPCGDCKHIRIKPAQFPYCKKKLMGVTETMLVSYNEKDGSCFEVKERRHG